MSLGVKRPDWTGPLNTTFYENRLLQNKTMVLNGFNEFIQKNMFDVFTVVSASSAASATFVIL
jgi:hypothetical protein